MKKPLFVFCALLLLLGIFPPVNVTAGAPFLPPQAAKSLDIKIPILAYHQVGMDISSEYNIPTAEFEKQLDVLKAYGYQTINLQDYLDYSLGKGTPPKKPVIITFDDGYQNLYKYAAPALKARGMTATFFIITGKIGTTEQNRQANTWQSSLPKAYHMIWSELAELHRQGFSIEAHTVSHPVLSDTRDGDAEYQLVQARGAIMTNVPGAEAAFLAYPFGVGSHDERVRSLVMQAGYKAAVGYSIDEGVANPSTPDLFAIPRISITNKITLDLDIQQPDTLFMRMVEPDFRLPNLEIGKLSVQDHWGALRAKFYAGEEVTLQVNASNWGQAFRALGTIELRDTSKKLVYNSHDQAVSQDSMVGMFSRGKDKGKFLFFWTPPLTTKPGKYDYSLQVYDVTHKLHYLTSEFSRAFEVLNSPLSVRSGSDQVTLQPGESRELVFTVANTGTAASQMALVVSFSPGLEVSSSDSLWKAAPAGSQVTRRGCSSKCSKSTDLVYELQQDQFPAGEQSFRLTIRPAAGASGAQWVRYRVAMNVPGQVTPYPLLYDPMSGTLDQQGYFSYRIPVSLK